MRTPSSSSLPSSPSSPATAYEGKARGDQIELTPAGQDSGTASFRIRRPAAGSEEIEGQTFFRGKPLETITLERGGILKSPIYESAPLTDLATTTDWLDSVSRGYFLHWQAVRPGE